MNIQIQCDSCAHKPICKIKEALTIATNTMKINYRFLSDEDKALADSVNFIADCRHYCRVSEKELRSDDQHYEWECFL